NSSDDRLFVAHTLPVIGCHPGTSSHDVISQIIAAGTIFRWIQKPSSQLGRCSWSRFVVVCHEVDSTIATATISRLISPIEDHVVSEINWGISIGGKTGIAAAVVRKQVMVKGGVATSPNTTKAMSSLAMG